MNVAVIQPNDLNPKKIKAVIFDFDGVLVESAQIKTQAFAELFSKYTDKVDAIVAYHLQNAGISRYVKFKFIYTEILQMPICDEDIVDLGIRFSEIVKDKIIQAPLIRGTLELLHFLKTRTYNFIASGTPSEELNDIVLKKGIASYFDGIFGTPKTKQFIIQEILKIYQISPSECVFIGDSLTDYAAARDCSVKFIAKLSDENEKLWPESLYFKVNDMQELKKLLKNCV